MSKRIIIALDFERVNQAKELLAQLDPSLCRVKIGKNCIIGAHALVPEGMEIPDNSLVMGAPAKVVKEISDGHKAMLTMSSQYYAAHAKHFDEHLEVDERFQ